MRKNPMKSIVNHKNGIKFWEQWDTMDQLLAIDPIQTNPALGMMFHRSEVCAQRVLVPCFQHT